MPAFVTTSARQLDTLFSPFPSRCSRRTASRRISPTASNQLPSTASDFTRPEKTPQPADGVSQVISPDVVSIVEECNGPPWRFRGRRLYIVDMVASECDVLENSAPAFKLFSSPFGPLRVLLPEGWPLSVGPGYGNWAKWHIGRHIFRNAYYVLGTTSLLSALGLGTGKALAVGATVKWVLKDGLGMGTKLLVSTNLARVVDADPKRWRFIGDSFMAMSAAIEILSVTKPVYFLIFGTIAAFVKEAGGAMSGPAYRVFLDSFARDSNIGDISSRGEAQVVIGNLIGLGMGVAIKTFLDTLPATDRLLPTLAFFGAFAASHLSCTFNAISTVQARTLNWQRLNIILEEFITSGKVPSVEDVNKAEKFIYLVSPPPTDRRLRLGAQLLDFVECGRDVSTALRNRSDRFIVAYNEKRVGVMLRDDAGPEDIVKAMLQGRRLLQMVDKNGGCEGWSRAQIAELTQKAYDWTGHVMPDLLARLAAQEWSTAKVLIAMEGSRYREKAPAAS